MSSGRPALPAGLRERVLAEAQRTAAPTRAAEAARARLRIGIGVLVTAALFFAIGGFRWGTRPAELIAWTAGVGLVAALVMTRLSSNGSSMLGRPRGTLLGATALSALGLLVAAFVAAFAWPAAAAEHVPPRSDAGCAALTLLLAAPVFVLLALPRRGSDPVHPAVTGAALGMTAGVWSASMAYLRCPHAAAEHCILAHVLPALLLAALGALVGRTLLKLV